MLTVIIIDFIATVEELYIHVEVSRIVMDNLGGLK
jgi:hypothetical protein